MTPQIRVRKTICEHLGGGRFLTMDEDGNIAEHRSAGAVVRWIKRRDAGDEFTATVIEWRYVPEDFEPPELGA